MGIWLVSQCFSGLSNAVSGYIFGNDQFQMTDKVSRNGASGGESTSKLGYLSDLIGRQPKSGQMGHFPGGAVTRTPYERLMDPRGTCILQDIFGGGLGVRKAYGYRYEMREPDQPEREGFDLGDFLRSTLNGGLMGGLSGVAFYGMGKAVEVLKGSLSGGSKQQGGIAVKYSPVNPGPLEEELANTFSGATYTKRVLTEDTVMYRVSGGNAREVGSYMSMTPQNGGLQSQLDLALNPAWGNTTENVTKVVVPKGTLIYEGIAAPQSIYDSLKNVIGTLPGGGNQVYIPEVETRWFQ